MDHNIKGSSTSTSKAEHLFQIPTKHMPHHAESLLVFKKRPFNFCPSVANFQGSSDYLCHGMTFLLSQFNIALIEKQATYFPLKLEIIFYCSDLSLFVFILSDLIVLILPA